MLPTTLRTTLIIAVICYFIIILVFLKNKALSLKYTLIWLFVGVALGIMVIFPNLLSMLTHFLGFESNMNGLFILGFAFVAMILMSLTSIVSRQNDKIKTLVQQQAILEKRIRELENNS